MLSPKHTLSLRKRESADESNELNTTMKRTKIDGANKENTEAKEKNNFVKMCLQISYEEFQDVRKRFQVLNLPECENNVCTHESRKLSSAAEKCIKIDLSSHSWCDTLDVCIMCIMSGQCLSGSVLKNIAEIIMNAHEDVNSGYTVDYILRQCQHTLLLNFSMHPPCYDSYTRDCYKDFLLSPMDEKSNNAFTNRKQYLSDEGIVAHCFERLMYEISKDSKDGSLVDNNNHNEVKEGIRELHWKKENMELYEFLERTERIDRLMMVLESVIHLVQTDLALCHIGYQSKTRSKRYQKPIINYLLWPNKKPLSGCDNINIKIGTTSLLCNQIMKLFAYFIHLQYPEEYITTMSLWMNAVVQIFYMSERFLGTDYPSPPTSCIRFSQEFCDIIKDLPSHSVLRILQRLQPFFMRHLVGENYIMSLPHIADKDIIHIIKSCVKDETWKKYSGDNAFLSRGKDKNGKIKLCSLINSEFKKCKICKVFNFNISNKDTVQSDNDAYPKLELDLKISEKKISKSFFVNLLFITFIAYLETYNIRHFRHRLEVLNTENKNDCDPEISEDYNITASFVKKYKSIIKALQDFYVLLDGKKDNFSCKLLEILKKYLS